jgi:hypothetical protein
MIFDIHRYSKEKKVKFSCSGVYLLCHGLVAEISGRKKKE